MMQIKYQKKLAAYPNEYSADGELLSANMPMTEEEVQVFENYCVTRFDIAESDYKFSLAYREYLLLAGNNCYVYETGGLETQMELQNYCQELVIAHQSEIPFPYVVIDMSGNSFSIIKLLDTDEDPLVYVAHLIYIAKPIEIISRRQTMSELTSGLIQMVLEGKSIF